MLRNTKTKMTHQVFVSDCTVGYAVRVRLLVQGARTVISQLDIYHTIPLRITLECKPAYASQITMYVWTGMPTCIY